MTWITQKLKEQIKEVFEPRYQRQLKEDEILTIAENLETVVEEILKLKWREQYEH